MSELPQRTTLSDTESGIAEALRSLPAEPGALWRALGELGVLTALYEDQSHGPRPDYLAELLAALDDRYPVGVVLSTCVQVATALPILREHAASGAAAPVYESAARGEVILALAATDVGSAGSDLMGLSTTARLCNEHLILDGEKRWITNACTAQYALVLARHRPQRHFTSFLWILVPTDAPGVSATPAPSQLFAGSGLGTLSFRSVVLSRDHVVGSPGRGLATFARHVATERLAGGLWASALCQRVLAETHVQLTTRPLGDGVMWNNPAIQQRFARCLVQAWRIDAACDSYRAVYTGPDALVSSMLLKAAVAESLDIVLAECTDLLGADAFTDHGVAQLRAQVGMFGIAGGAVGAMLAGIADHVTDLVRRCD